MKDEREPPGFSPPNTSTKRKRGSGIDLPRLRVGLVSRTLHRDAPRREPSRLQPDGGPTRRLRKFLTRIKGISRSHSLLGAVIIKEARSGGLSPPRRN